METLHLWNIYLLSSYYVLGIVLYARKTQWAWWTSPSLHRAYSLVKKSKGHAIVSQVVCDWFRNHSFCLKSTCFKIPVDWLFIIHKCEIHWFEINVLRFYLFMVFYSHLWIFIVPYWIYVLWRETNIDMWRKREEEVFDYSIIY